MLGDNIFFGGDHFPRAVREFKGGATIFAYVVRDPRRYGVIEFDAATGRALSIEEKPENPKSNFAVPGIYIYDHSVIEIAKNLRPSARGELEITDVNRAYLAQEKLYVHKLSRGFAWLDAGTSSSLQEVSAYVATIENRQGIKIGCPEEASLWSGFLSIEKFEALVAGLPTCEYKDYLAMVAKEWHRSNKG